MAVIMCVLICTIRITFCATSSLSPTVRVKCFEGVFILSAAVLSNPIEEGTVQCIVEKLDLVTGHTAGQDGTTLVMR